MWVIVFLWCSEVVFFFLKVVVFFLFVLWSGVYLVNDVFCLVFMIFIIVIFLLILWFVFYFYVIEKCNNNCEFVNNVVD